MPITIADVAARAKVSKTTMSRVLNDKGELNESTAARVRKVPSLTWPWTGEVVQDAVDVLETERYGLLLFTCNRGDESMRQFGAQVSVKSFDGLLVIEPESTLDYIAMLHARGLPVVLIDDRDVHPDQIPSVSSTNHTGAGAAARHLLSLGRNKPLVIAGAPRLHNTTAGRLPSRHSPPCLNRCARWARSRHACFERPAQPVPPSYRQRSRSAPPPRVHNRYRPRPSSGTPLTDFRNT